MFARETVIRERKKDPKSKIELLSEWIGHADRVTCFSPWFQLFVTICTLLPEIITLITEPLLGGPAVMAFKFQLGLLAFRKRRLRCKDWVL